MSPPNLYSFQVAHELLKIQSLKSIVPEGNKTNQRCPQCEEELIIDVRNFWLLPKIWTDYVCPRCGKRYSVSELVKGHSRKTTHLSDKFTTDGGGAPRTTESAISSRQT